MSSSTPGTFRTSREIPAAVGRVFAAIADPERLARWWGPAGFTNTFRVCDFRVGGRWTFTMHAPNGADFANENVFLEIEEPGRVVVQHVSEPKFRLTLCLAPTSTGTVVSWEQVFESAEFAGRVEHIVAPANEENLDRLTAEVLREPSVSLEDEPGNRAEAMTSPAGPTLREVVPLDIETFHRHRLDPEAVRMAAFVGTGASDKAAYIAHWERNLRAPQNTNRTILFEGRVAGHIASFRLGEELEVTYWLGREFWGRGLATGALRQLLLLVAERPIHARAASDNIGSIRVLRKCGFEIVGRDKGFAQGRGEPIEEVHLLLDRDPAVV